jgi:hypothetical protein
MNNKDIDLDLTLPLYKVDIQCCNQEYNAANGLSTRMYVDSILKEYCIS